MSGLVAFIAGHRAEFVARLGEHVILVFASTAVAAAIGIPLGIVAARRPAIARPIVALANLAQTIPSLALFGFLIPLPLVGGIGTRTALAALTAEVLQSTPESATPEDRVSEWEQVNAASIARASNAMGDVDDSPADLAALSVLLRQIRTLVKTSSAS